MWIWGHFIVTQLLCNTCITINENSPLFGSFVSPYFAHDASCVMLNIDWTPLFPCLAATVSSFSLIKSASSTFVIAGSIPPYTVNWATTVLLVQRCCVHSDIFVARCASSFCCWTISVFAVCGWRQLTLNYCRFSPYDTHITLNSDDDLQVCGHVFSQPSAVAAPSIFNWGL